MRPSEENQSGPYVDQITNTHRTNSQTYLFAFLSRHYHLSLFEVIKKAVHLAKKPT